MKLKYVAIHGRKRTIGALIIAVFLSAPFVATLLMALTGIDASLRDGTWMIPVSVINNVTANGADKNTAVINAPIVRLRP